MIERLRKCRRINDPIMNFFEDGRLFYSRSNLPKKYSFLVFEKPLDLHRGKFAPIFFQALSASVPNFIEIGGVTRKPLVDLTV